MRHEIVARHLIHEIYVLLRHHHRQLNRGTLEAFATNDALLLETEHGRLRFGVFLVGTVLFWLILHAVHFHLE